MTTETSQNEPEPVEKKPTTEFLQVPTSSPKHVTAGRATPSPTGTAVASQSTAGTPSAVSEGQDGMIAKLLEHFQQQQQQQQVHAQTQGQPWANAYTNQQLAITIQMQASLTNIQSIEKKLEKSAENFAELLDQFSKASRSPEQKHSPSSPSFQSGSNSLRGKFRDSDISTGSNGTSQHSGSSSSASSLMRPQHGLPPLAMRGRPHFHPGTMDENIQLEELDRFAKEFKQKRIKLGFTQGDVGVAMGRLYGSDFSQTTISRFEALNLSFKNMCKLKPILERWLEDAERYLTPNQQSLSTEAQLESARRRKKRTSIDNSVKVALEMHFLRNSRPTSAEITQLAEDLEMERETVRVWFCNRRQKEKRIGSHGEEENASIQDSEPTSPVGTTHPTLPASSPIAQVSQIPQIPVSIPLSIQNADFYQNLVNMQKSGGLFGNMASEIPKLPNFGFFPQIPQISAPNQMAEITELPTAQ
ncbi:Oidioi.mRNA.OKI2018_I69.chr2.g5910.t1.cds [Oikopleura dioica]|uniref:POU domain protein n=1 Tax=Oikopleura dioica TaxID=34765 RepID=A0ABN7T670_OIKDI|nr:Oidioi.mRNA.OKI2018_I69.chr2.g5910.t1.cds [Oikopleura dioica]